MRACRQSKGGDGQEKEDSGNGELQGAGVGCSNDILQEGLCVGSCGRLLRPGTQVECRAIVLIALGGHRLLLEHALALAALRHHLRQERRGEQGHGRVKRHACAAAWHCRCWQPPRWGCSLQQRYEVQRGLNVHLMRADWEHAAPRLRLPAVSWPLATMCKDCSQPHSRTGKYEWNVLTARSHSRIYTNVQALPAPEQSGCTLWRCGYPSGVVKPAVSGGTPRGSRQRGRTAKQAYPQLACFHTFGWGAWIFILAHPGLHNPFVLSAPVRIHAVHKACQSTTDLAGKAHLFLGRCQQLRVGKRGRQQASKPLPP